MSHYRLSQNVHVELFDEDAVLFIADRDQLLTVNKPAADIFVAARDALAERLFTRSDCADLLLASYDLSPQDADREAQALLAFGLRHRIVVKGG